MVFFKVLEGPNIIMAVTCFVVCMCGLISFMRNVVFWPKLRSDERERHETHITLWWERRGVEQLVDKMGEWWWLLMHHRRQMVTNHDDIGSPPRASNLLASNWRANQLGYTALIYIYCTMDGIEINREEKRPKKGGKEIFLWKTWGQISFWIKEVKSPWFVLKQLKC